MENYYTNPKQSSIDEKSTTSRQTTPNEMSLFPTIIDCTCYAQPSHPLRDQHDDAQQQGHPHLERAVTLIRKCSIPHHKQPEHLELETIESHQHSLKSKHSFPDLRNIATRVLSPITHLGSSLTHNHTEQLEEKMEERVKEQNPLQIGPPLCREAEIEKWKTNVKVTEQKLVLD